MLSLSTVRVTHSRWRNSREPSHGSVRLPCHLSESAKERASAASASATAPPALEELSLAGNPLRLTAAPLLPPAAQGALRSLDLSNCSLDALPAAALRGALNLTELLLHDNPLEERLRARVSHAPCIIYPSARVGKE
ncbi:Protein of unknown function [Gryllus bimaculatus]|nr:Protein of unknown function [Gryllus bimaculatus]